MTYNTELQTNNTTLQSILATAQNLPDKSNAGTTVQKWTFTLDDGSTVDKYVEFIKTYNIIGIDTQLFTYSNSATTIKHGQTYENTLYYQYYEDYGRCTVYVGIGGWPGDDPVQEFYFESDADGIVHISIPNITGDIYLDYEI